MSREDGIEQIVQDVKQECDCKLTNGRKDERRFESKRESKRESSRDFQEKKRNRRCGDSRNRNQCE